MPDAKPVVPNRVAEARRSLLLEISTDLRSEAAKLRSNPLAREAFNRLATKLGLRLAEVEAELRSSK